MRLFFLILGLVLGAVLAQVGVDVSGAFVAMGSAGRDVVDAGLRLAGVDRAGPAARLVGLLVAAATPGLLLALVAATARAVGSASRVAVTVVAGVVVVAALAADLISGSLAAGAMLAVVLGLALGALRVAAWLLSTVVGTAAALLLSVALNADSALTRLGDQVSQAGSTPLWSGVLVGFAVLPLVGAAALCVRTAGDASSTHEHP